MLARSTQRAIPMLVFLLAAPLVITGLGKDPIKIPEEDVAQTVCTLALLRQYFFSGETLSGSVLAVTITSALPHIQQQLLAHMQMTADMPWSVLVLIMDQEPLRELIMHEKPQCYFLVIENMENEDLDDIFETWKSHFNWNPLAQFVIYLAEMKETDEEMTEVMVEILLSFMSKKIFNVNVIGQHEESSFYYGKTVFPYHPDNNCGNRVIAVETLDTCSYQQSDRDGVRDIGDGGAQDETLLDNADVYDFASREYVNERSTENESSRNKLDSSYKISSVERMRTYDDTDDSVESPKVRKETTNNSNELLKNLTVYPKLLLKQYKRALFTDKFPLDLSGCPLVAAYRPWEPYIFSIDEENTNDYYVENFPSNTTLNEIQHTIPERDESEGDDSYMDMASDSVEDFQAAIGDTVGIAIPKKLSGIEYQLLKTIGERLHISIEINIENSNLYHLFQQLIDGQIELIVGGIDEDPGISQFVASTIPYHQDDLTWCVTKAKRSHNLFNFLASFKTDAWFLLLAYILTSSLAIIFAQRLLNLRTRQLQGYLSVCIRILSNVLNQTINYRPESYAVSFILATTFYFGLLFSNAYQSFLVSTLTTPHSSYQISHLAEIYSNRMSIMGSVDNVRHLNKEGEIFKYIREKFQMCYNIEECLNRAAVDPHIAVAVSRQHSFYNPRIQRDQLYCFDRNENLYMYLITMLLPKKFHLLHQINPVIQHIIESGHMQKWARDLDMRRKIHEEINRVREDPFKKLTLAQFNGAFIFVSGLLSFALVVFVLEHLVYWLVVRRRTRFRLARILHRQFRQQLQKN